MADKELTRNQKLSAAYGAASNRLKAAHLDEWNGYMTEETQARGEKWQPKPTEEQKAEAELRELLAKNPALADKVPSILGQPPLPTSGDDAADEEAEVDPGKHVGTPAN